MSCQNCQMNSSTEKCPSNKGTSKARCMQVDNTLVDYHIYIILKPIEKDSALFSKNRILTTLVTLFTKIVNKEFKILIIN